MSRKNLTGRSVAKIQKLVNRGNPKPHGKTKSTKIRRRHMERIKNFFKDESGASAVEYGLLVSLIAVAIIVAVQALGTGITNTFTTAAGSLG
jgi:pilus assembly protein Flp/PilA